MFHSDGTGQPPGSSKPGSLMETEGAVKDLMQEALIHMRWRGRGGAFVL